jgi:hypothetical protein
MKNVITFIALFCIVIACNNFSKGVKKDLTTGLSVTYNGFSIDDVSLVNAQNERMSNNEIAVGQSVAIVVDGIENYTEQDGKVFPILDITVTDKNGAVVLDGKDILGHERLEKNGFTPEYGANLRGTITVGAPMTAGETYHATMKISDQRNAENVIDAEVDLVVK